MKATKLGRPTDNPKNIQARIRMTQDEADMLNKCAEKLNMTKTDVIVKGIKLVFESIKR